jgi:hypothetical protein
MLLGIINVTSFVLSFNFFWCNENGNKSKNCEKKKLFQITGNEIILCKNAFNFHSNRTRSMIFILYINAGPRAAKKIVQLFKYRLLFKMTQLKILDK